MIKVIITSDSSPPVTWHVKQFPIVVGNEKAADADIKLSGQSLLDRHVEITEHIDGNKTSYSVTNLANDPFVTLNNLPFGKQPLYINDVIQIGDYFLRFEHEVEHVLHEPSLFDEDRTLNLPQPKEEVGHLQKQSLTSTSLESLEEAEKASSNNYYPYANSTFQKLESPGITPIHNQKLSLKDFYLSEYDDHEDSAFPFEKKSKHSSSPHMTKSWRAYFTLIFGCVGFLSILISIFYLWISDQTEEEENKAARGVADIAMALTHAQLKNIYPQNQNWSYPEFIKNNLTSILAPNYSPLVDVDTHGQFANCPYTLRIHTSSDLSQFLVIAQPAPSLLQWLIPKASIIVDSRAMEMRKITDLKALNRLIVNSSGLEGVSTNEISNLIKQGELIPLATLISKAENQGLTPPKALGLIRPGAENLIYNAPRYYLFGEIILNTSLDVFDKKANSKETGLLQHELSNLMGFPDFVLYSSGGLQHALKAQKALASLAPKDRYLIAYLQMNAHGKITGAHLVMDDSQNDVAIGGPSSEMKHSSDELEMPIGDDPSIKNGQISKEGQGKENGEIDNQIDTDAPLFRQLQTLANSRQNTLQPIASEMIALIKKQTASAQPEFGSLFSKLQQKYVETDLLERNKIFSKLAVLSQENHSISAAKFLEFIQAAKLKVLFQEYLLQLQQTSKEQQVSDEQVEKQFKQIQTSANWDDLEHQVAEINQLLHFERLSDEERIVAFQNSARSIVTQKLNQFILSNEALPANSFNLEHLQTLTNILKSVWITDPDTHDFYVTEFKLRS